MILLQNCARAAVQFTHLGKVAQKEALKISRKLFPEV